MIALPTHRLRSGAELSCIVGGRRNHERERSRHRVGIRLPRRRRRVHAALILVALDELGRAVARPVDQRAKTAALENSVVVHLLVERNVRAALRPDPRARERIRPRARSPRWRSRARTATPP